MSNQIEQGVTPHQIKDLVYNRLREDLINQTFKPGEPMREASLTELLGVSKTPIREALVRLAQDGLIEIAPYRGARASVYTPEFLQELYQVREILEGECVRRAAENTSKELIKKLNKTIENGRKGLTSNNLKKVANSLDDFDSVLFDSLNNRFLDGLQDQINMHLQRIGRVGFTKNVAEHSLDQHEEIVAEIAAGDPVAAERSLKKHLQEVLSSQMRLLDNPPE